MRIFGRPAHQKGVPAKVLADAAEQRLKNMHARGRLAEAEKWETRLRLLVASLRSRAHELERAEIGFGQRVEGFRQAAIDLEEVVDELAAGRGR